MKLNKYRLGSTLRYNFTSPEEYQQRSMYMRGMHDLTQQAILNQEKELQIEYADVDNQYVSPKIEYLQNKLNNLTQKVAKGYNPLIADELVQTRREYLREAGPKGTIGRAQSNYKAMQQAVSDYDKAHPGGPDWFRDVAKKNIIANYKGMYDAGNFVEFTPGRATGYRDVGEDFLSYAKNYSGVSEDDLGNFMTGQIGMHAVQGPNGQTYLQVVEKTPGTRITNKPQLEALLNEFYSQYTDPNTDRGLFAQLAQKSPEEIQRTLGNMSQVAGVNKYGINPGWNANVQRVDKPKTSSTGTKGGGWGFPKYSNELPLDISKSVSKDLQKVEELIFLVDKSKETIESDVFGATMFALNLDPKYKNLPQKEKESIVNRRIEGSKASQNNWLGDLEKLKEDYSILNPKNKTEKQFLSDLKQYLKERSANVKSLTSLDTPNAMEFLETNIGLDNKESLTRIKKGDSRSPEKTSFTNFKKGFADSQTFGRKQVFFDENLNIFVQDANNTVYKVNKDLSDLNQTVYSEMRNLQDFKNASNITEDTANIINSTPLRSVAGDPSAAYAIRVSKDKNGNFIKYVQVYSVDEQEIPQIQNVSIEDFTTKLFPSKAMNIIFTDLSKYNK